MGETASALKHVAAKGDAKSVNRLVQLLEDTHWWTRLAAVEALAAVAAREHKEAVSHVLELLEGDVSEQPCWHVKEETAAALVGISSDSSTFIARGEPLDLEDVHARCTAVTLMCQRLDTKSA